MFLLFCLLFCAGQVGCKTWEQSVRVNQNTKVANFKKNKTMSCKDAVLHITMSQTIKTTHCHLIKCYHKILIGIAWKPLLDINNLTFLTPLSGSQTVRSDRSKIQIFTHMTFSPNKCIYAIRLIWKMLQSQEKLDKRWLKVQWHNETAAMMHKKC